jgi:hypothetical protein
MPAARSTDDLSIEWLARYLAHAGRHLPHPASFAPGDLAVWADGLQKDDWTRLRAALRASRSYHRRTEQAAVRKAQQAAMSERAVLLLAGERQAWLDNAPPEVRRALELVWHRHGDDIAPWEAVAGGLALFALAPPDPPRRDTQTATC